MGAEYSCQTAESEEETVNKIFEDMFKKDLQTGIIYENFIKCIIYYPNQKKIRISKKLFSKFLDCILEENRYVDLYKDFFIHIIDENSEIESIRKIGLILIGNGFSKESFEFIKQCQYDHFINFYLGNSNENLKEGENNMHIELSAKNEISSSTRCNTASDEVNRTAISLKKNKSDEIENRKLFAFDGINKGNVELKNNNLNDYFTKKDKAKINIYDLNYLDLKSYELDFDNNILSFYKKKEFEYLEHKIINFISDLIEINSTCLVYFLRHILSVDRLKTLTKSWGNNIKKLLLFNIHRNYTTLVENFCLHPNYNSLFSFKENDFSNHHLNYLITPKNKSSKNIKVDTINKKITLDKSNLDYDINNKKTIQRELERFIENKEKLIVNFFKLIETQITGDAIRNWLYENSR